MKIEHAAWQVADPAAVADWYVAHLGMTVVRTFGPPGNARFLADATGRTLLEIYHNPSAPLMDYAATNPLVLHLAFAVEAVEAERDRLVAAGATVVDALTVTSAGDRMAMLRDPWGFAIQLLRRKAALP
ncbi:MAG: hypothetical protein BIFFINMI_03699 [Phycisphaerae bacterium]|nr:hypothetical protein [Phycisphaerae bacterium]